MQAAGVDRIMLVQCSTEWLRPSHLPLRDDLDAVVREICLRRPRVRVDRIVLHNLPVRGVGVDDLAELSAALSEWMYRLSVTAMLQPHPHHRIHRLIIDGSATAADVDDSIDTHRRGTWSQPAETDPVLKLLATGRRVTPLTGYDIDLDGPFGDTDPSVYL